MTVVPFRPRGSDAPAAAPDAPRDGERRTSTDLRTPALFLSHGSPLAIVEDDFKQTLRNFGAHLRQPRGVLVMSAHWPSMRPLRVSSHKRPPILHDFEGFPTWLSSLSYRCPGSPAVAEQVIAVLGEAGIAAALDPNRGLDSAAWMPLSLIYPSAKVPVVQISVPAPVAPREVVAIGAALAPLRRKGIMLVGSGGVVHNPERARFEAPGATEPWALSFDTWVRERLEAMDVESLCDYRAKAPTAFLAAPTSEHLDPLFFVLGARLPGDNLHPLFEGFHAGNLSLRSFVLWGKRAADQRLPDSLALSP